ncbi:hypothetical protein PCE1_004797 [Barthelona sp. PCE]
MNVEDFAIDIPVKRQITKITPQIRQQAYQEFGAKYLERMNITPTKAAVNNIIKELLAENALSVEFVFRNNGLSYESLHVSANLSPNLDLEPVRANRNLLMGTLLREKKQKRKVKVFSSENLTENRLLLDFLILSGTFQQDIFMQHIKIIKKGSQRSQNDELDVDSWTENDVTSQSLQRIMTLENLQLLQHKLDLFRERSSDDIKRVRKLHMSQYNFFGKYSHNPARNVGIPEPNDFSLLRLDGIRVYLELFLESAPLQYVIHHSVLSEVDFRSILICDVIINLVFVTAQYLYVTIISEASFDKNLRKNMTEGIEEHLSLVKEHILSDMDLLWSRFMNNVRSRYPCFSHICSFSLFSISSCALAVLFRFFGGPVVVDPKTGYFSSMATQIEHLLEIEMYDKAQQLLLLDRADQIIAKSIDIIGDVLDPYHSFSLTRCFVNIIKGPQSTKQPRRNTSLSLNIAKKASHPRIANRYATFKKDLTRRANRERSTVVKEKLPHTRLKHRL